jgi:O-antigen/teichoic acid export membrane protein
MKRSGVGTGWFRYELWLYGTGTLVWLSGVAYLVSHYLPSGDDPLSGMPHPADIWCLRVHGAVMLAFLAAFGAMVPTHMRPAWRRRTNRWSGLSMILVVTILVLTGYGLYYVGEENTRAWISAAHWGLGLGAAGALIVHRALGRRRRRMEQAARGERTTERTIAASIHVSSAPEG